VILACSKTFAEKRNPENRMPHRIRNSRLDFITEEIWHWTLWIITSGKVFEVNHWYRL